MSYGLTGNIKHSNGLLTRHKRSGEKKLLNRRKSMPGYPKEFKFTTPEEVYNYFNSERLICLLCGKTYKLLGTHLLIHGSNVESYREKYGLPYSRGLVGIHLKKHKSDRMKKMLSDGVITISKEDGDRYRELAHKARRRKAQPYRKSVSIRNGNKGIAKLTNTPIESIHGNIWKDEDYWKILKIMKDENRAPREVLQDKSIVIPRSNSFYNKVKTDDVFRKSYFDILDNLPNEVLAKHQILGKKIREEITVLKSQSFTHAYIADKCNVSMQTINNIVKELGLKTVEKTHCKMGHAYIDEKRKCKICNTDNSRKRRGHFPREISKVTIVKVSCTNCGDETATNRLGMSRPVIYCDACKKKFYLQSQQKYKINNIEKRREMARASHKARKEKKSTHSNQ